MLMIRLSRVGKTKQPSYRVIVSEKQQDPWGKYLEIVGSYNPLVKPKQIKLNAERIQYWISKGAQASATVHNLLVDQKVITDKKVKNTATKVGKRKVAARAAAKAAAAKAAEPKPEPVAEVKTEETPATEPAA